MLLTGLQCHTQCAIALRINTYTDDTTWDASLEFIFTREECSVRTTKAQWYPKTLRVTDSNICTQLSRRSKQRKCHQICSKSDISAIIMHSLNKSSVIFNSTHCIWILH